MKGESQAPGFPQKLWKTPPRFACGEGRPCRTAFTNKFQKSQPEKGAVAADATAAVSSRLLSVRPYRTAGQQGQYGLVCRTLRDQHCPHKARLQRAVLGKTCCCAPSLPFVLSALCLLFGAAKCAQHRAGGEKQQGVAPASELSRHKRGIRQGQKACPCHLIYSTFRRLSRPLAHRQNARCWSPFCEAAPKSKHNRTKGRDETMSTTTTPNTNTAPPSGAPREAHQRATFEGQGKTMTMAQWKKTHKDFKTCIDGQRMVLAMTSAGTSLVPVKIIKEK